MYSVMLVDDERPSLELLKLLIRWEDADFFICCEASSGQDALNKYSIYKPDLIITDLLMPVMDGLELIQKIKNENPEQLVIVLSCHELFDYARSALKLGVYDYLVKDSLTPAELLSTLEQIKSRLPIPNLAISKCFSNISDYSPRVRKTVEYIMQYYDQNNKLSTIADQFGIHKNHLARIFKEETGVSIHEAILGLRIEKAKHLLLDPESKVSDIILKVGFRNPQNFYTLFKKHTGLSPSEYRSQSLGTVSTAP